MTKFKSNIKTKKFYAEAEEMSPGWGRYLKLIDKLKNDVDKKRDITLDNACWILYGEGHCSYVWEEFKKYCISKRWGKRKMPWEDWKGIFNES